MTALPSSEPIILLIKKVRRPKGTRYETPETKNETIKNGRRLSHRGRYLFGRSVIRLSGRHQRDVAVIFLPLPVISVHFAIFRSSIFSISYSLSAVCQISPVISSVNRYSSFDPSFSQYISGSYKILCHATSFLVAYPLAKCLLYPALAPRATSSSTPVCPQANTLRNLRKLCCYLDPSRYLSQGPFVPAVVRAPSGSW